MRRAHITLSACAIGGALVAGPAWAQAPIVTDGTMGARVELNGPAMQIPHTLGTQAGPNLFHSFQRFNIPTQNSATFTGPGGINNVISRVTGGEASTIDGTFRSTIPGANVWFTNPAGVTFGPNASLDVPASFHASTANEIRFPDGGRFSADLGATSTLSVAPPEAFGFLSSNPAPLKVEKSQLSVGTDATLSLAAGEIDIQGNAPTLDVNRPELVDINGGTLRAPSGTINLASVGGPAEIKTDGTVSGNNHGAIRLTNGALVNASGDGAGLVRIRGGELTATGSYIIASNTGSVAGAGGIDISADRLSLQHDGRSSSLVAANADNAGNAAPINVRAPDIAMRNSYIRSNAYAAGKAGDIRIEAANQMTLDNFAGVHANSFGLDPAGAGGNITVHAGNLLIRGQSQITSLTRGRAPAGNLDVTAGTLLVDSALAAGEQPRYFTGIISSAESGSSGNAGTIIVHANHLTVDGPSAHIDSSSYSNSTGNAGTVRIEANNLTLKNGNINGSIISSTTGSGKAGNIQIDVANQMTLDNFGIIAANSLSLDPAAAGGEITVNAGNLLIRGQSQINSITRGPAPAGNISVTAGTLLIDGLTTGQEFPASIGASARSELNRQKTTPGKAGNITIHAGEIRLTNGAQIRSETEGPHDAGNITLIVPGTLIVENGSQIFNTTYEKGNAGTMTIAANNLTLNNNGSISSTTGGSGKAGNIRIDVSNLMTLDNHGDVVASSLRDAAPGGGEITVHAGNLVIRGQSQITSLTRGRAPAGNLDVTAGTLLIDSALAAGEQPRYFTGIFSSAESGSSGNAGTIIVHADNLVLKGPFNTPQGILGLASIDSSTLSSGNAGVVTIEANNLTLEGDAGISSESFGSGSGAAGEIILTGVSKLFLSDGARVTTQSGSAGGGNIEISGAGIIVLRDNSRIGVDTVTGQQAGDITIDSRFLVLDRSFISADAKARSGGSIRITPSTRQFVSPDSKITARGGPAGLAGTVLMNPETDVTVDVAQLPGAVMNTADQMQERCAVRGLVEGSSFTIAGPEALSPTLEGYLAGTYAKVADEDTAITDGSLMVASGGGLAFPVWTVACGDAR